MDPYLVQIILTSAYYEQFHTLGWFQLCLDCISQQWSHAMFTYQAPNSPHFDNDDWAAILISLLWRFTRLYGFTRINLSMANLWMRQYQHKWQFSMQKLLNTTRVLEKIHPTVSLDTSTCSLKDP
jgi:hypothetical protein